MYFNPKSQKSKSYPDGSDGSSPSNDGEPVSRRELSSLFSISPHKKTESSLEPLPSAETFGVLTPSYNMGVNQPNSPQTRKPEWKLKSNRFSVSIDKITCTFASHDTKDLILSWFDDNRLGWLGRESMKPHPNYSRSIGGEGWSINEGHDSARPYKLDLHGAFCSFIGAEKQYEIISRLYGAVHFTRVDTAVDIFTFPLLLHDIKHSIDAGELYKIKCHSHIVSNGETIYLGSTKSPAFVRVYDKAAERGEDKTWIRWEKQTREPSDHLIKNTMSVVEQCNYNQDEFFRMLCFDAILFARFLDNPGNRFRDRKHVPWYERLCDCVLAHSGAFPLRSPSFSPKTDVLARSAWIRQQVGPLFEKMASVYSSKIRQKVTPGEFLDICLSYRDEDDGGNRSISRITAVDAEFAQYIWERAQDFQYGYFNKEAEK